MKKTSLPSLCLALCLALAACSSGSGGFLVVPRPDGGQAGTSAAGAGAAGTGAAGAANTKTYTFQAAINRDVDILVMVDNSLSMKAHQQKLTASFSALTGVLEKLPGGLPNLHLGVVSSNMGAGPYAATDIPSCPAGGDRGALQAMPRGTTCATGSLNPGQNFIIADGSGVQNNFTGTLADTFSCIAALGDVGCGFEHQLASVLRALGADGAPPPPTNTGFLRPNAYLAIVLLTNEDDCSAPPDSTLFNPASRHVSDPLGPLSSYRCNEFGHVCAGVPPPRTPRAGGDDLTGTCTSAEDGRLLKIADVTTRLKALKPDPSKIVVAAIGAPQTPYVIDTVPATLKDDPVQAWPAVRHSCMAADLSFGDPAIRIAKLVENFGNDGIFQVICAESLAPSLEAIGAKIGKVISPVPCLDAGTEPGKCTFVNHTTNAQGMRVDTQVPSCLANGDQAPCWEARLGAACGSGLVVQFHTAPGPTDPQQTTTATCSL